MFNLFKKITTKKANCCQVTITEVKEEKKDSPDDNMEQQSCCNTDNQKRDA